MTVETFISAEALRVADEYIDYRLASGWELIEIAAVHDLFRADFAREDLRRILARDWQGQIAPAARHADYERRMARRAA